MRVCAPQALKKPANPPHQHIKTVAQSRMAQYPSFLTLSPPKSQPMASLRGSAATVRLLHSASRVRLSLSPASSSLSISSSSSYSPSSLKCLQFSPLAPHIFKDQVSLPSLTLFTYLNYTLLRLFFFSFLWFVLFLFLFEWRNDRQWALLLRRLILLSWRARERILKNSLNLNLAILFW
jgi:hypothetical protein